MTSISSQVSIEEPKLTSEMGVKKVKFEPTEMPNWALRSLHEDQDCDRVAKKEQRRTPERELKAYHFEYRKLSERE
jgi:hypothetical protein